MAGLTSVSDAYRHAVRLYEARRYGDAQSVLHNIVQVVPGQSDALHLLGACVLMEGRFADAVKWLERAVAHSPGDHTRLNTLAVALLHAGQPAEALPVVDRAIELQPDYVEAWSNKALVLAELGRDDEALAVCEHALSLRPRDARVHVNRGHLLMRRGLSREALEAFRHALKIDPADPAAGDLSVFASHLAILSFFDPASPYVARLPVSCRDDHVAAVEAINDGRYLPALDMLARLIQLDPENLDNRILAGVAEYRRGNFAVAQNHLEGLVGTRLDLAQEAIWDDYRQRVASAIALQDLREKVFNPEHDRLPPIVDGDDEIHLLGSFPNNAGTELHLLEIAERLARLRPVRVWSTHPFIHALIAKKWPKISVVDPVAGRVPEGGVLVVFGAWNQIGEWYAQARFRRVIVSYNVDDPRHLLSIVNKLGLPGKPKVELIFASDWMKDGLDLPGHFEPAPIDIEEFAPVARAPAGHFVVGRLSRDDHYKFHPGSVRLFSRIAESGMAVRLMGATVLQDKLGGRSNVEILPANAIDASKFLGGIDCFLYRTHAYFPEPWGRVVVEAMACGLPVVAHCTGGYAQIIHHGVNGFLFSDDDEAYELICTLRNDAGIRRRVGLAARQTVERLFANENFEQFLRVYLK